MVSAREALLRCGRLNLFLELGRGVHLPVQNDLLEAPLCEPGLEKLPHKCLLPGHDVVDRLLHVLLRDVLAQRWKSSRTNKQQDTDLAHVVEELLTRRVDERVPVRLL